LLTHKQRSNLLALLIWRAVASALLSFVMVSFYAPLMDAQQEHDFLDLWVLWLANGVLQVYLWRYVPRGFSAQLFYQLLSDLGGIGVLIFMTGGLHSPFVLLLGLMIVIAGTQARVLVVLSTAVFSCIIYLLAVYLFAWAQASPLPEEATLKLLLQTSVFLLVGGVMAIISRRHAALESESERVVQEHHKLEQLHSDLMTSMQEGVLVLDADLTVVDCNPAFLQVLQQGDVVGMALTDLADFPEALLQALSSQKKQVVRVEWAYMEATYLLTLAYFSQSQKHAHCWLTVVDLSTLRQLEKKLMEQERLASLGRLAGMLAHEFRNPIQTIGQATELMPKLPEKTQHTVQKIVEEEIQRLNRLVTDMVDYAQPVLRERESMQVAEVVDSIVKQDAFCSSTVDVHLELDAIDVDAHHWRRVLENLLHHALDANVAANRDLPEGANTGTIGVEVKAVGQGWCLCVQDHGEMLSESMRLQMFEPFGEHRGGTGLGLATVWQICEVNHWQLTVKSDPMTTCICVASEQAVEPLGMDALVEEEGA